MHWFDAEDQQMSDTFEFYWGNFAHTGNPNLPSDAVISEKYPNWPQYDEQSDLSIAMKVPTTVNVGLKKDICDFWDTVEIKELYRQ